LRALPPEELEVVVGGKPLRVQAREHGQQRHEAGGAGQPVGRVARGGAPLQGDRQHEDAEVRRDPSELNRAALGALRPGRVPACPRRESGEQSDRDPASGAETHRQHPGQRAERDDPPDGDADL
jgi:hypothetical protein